MGTRSIIAIGTREYFRGRYVHFDGYPEGVGLALSEIMRRDGIKPALNVLIDQHTGWSSVTPDADNRMPHYYTQERFVPVPGYGVAYTEAEQPDDYMTQSSDFGWCEYTYVVNEDTGDIEVGVINYDNSISWIGSISITGQMTIKEDA